MIDRAANGRVYDLAHPLDPAMPVSPNHPGYRMALLRRHGDTLILLARPTGLFGAASDRL